MLQRIASSLKYRAKWANLGVLYARQPDISHIKVGGRPVRLQLPNDERPRQEHEFHKIVFEDCYRLASAPSANTVLDIGANIGLFAIAARNRFPRATIHCYEPNAAVLPNLRAHGLQIDASCFPEAVGLTAGKISLQTSGDGSLFSVSKPDAAGLIDQVSFASAVGKLGNVDLLKLDCEGAEWQIFEDRETWKSVKHLVMEYHLWAKEGSTVAELKSVIAGLGFSRVDVREDSPKFGIVFASRA
ncbi:FkbM family methyltransferase [Azospirillum sp.]|uniref:FkbM family methyltransferase n=1 Tax=Azospirillum sp. TaxID=34012 RepID=UPI002D37F72A|nr:FkbM family methyltransferase [Azospirillum sp.]HYD66178.1 FkbM family methyltransferase [Azospirillum sp.]